VLAVHKNEQSSCSQKNGLGKITLIKALEYLYEVNSHMRAFAIIVDCLNPNAEKFYLKFGFEKLYSNKGRVRLFIPMKKVAELFSTKRYIKYALEADLIEMTISDKPNSLSQRYQ
jgi:hypothetical protein